MGKILDIDGPVMHFLNKVADLMWLNILTLICCIPLFTIGASLTAAHYVALKIRRGEESYILKEFFHSFKMNFKQSTLIWLIMLLFLAFLGADFFIMKEGMVEVPQLLEAFLMAIGIFYIFLLIWVFPVQAKFVNSLGRTLKNALALSIIQLPKTLLMAVMYVLPYVIAYLSWRVLPLVLVFGISVPIYVSAILYNKMFKKLEDKIMEREAGENPAAEDENAEDDGVEKIFSDKPLIVGEDEK